MKLISKVKGFEGPCYPVWLNDNQVCNRLDRGVTGFFKLKKKPDRIKVRFLFWDIWLRPTQEEFHGIITGEGFVISTEGMIG